LSCDFILFSTVWPLNLPKKSLFIYNWPPRHNWNIVEYIQWSAIIVYYSIFQSKWD
jgi:hypothetical protein